MSLFIRQENERTELQKRLAAELAEKAKKKANAGDTDLPDGVEDSAYMENQKQTTSLAWVWVLIIAAVIGIMIWLVVATR